MNKYNRITCNIISIIMLLIFCDYTFSQTKDNYFSGVILSLKAGFHSGDYSEYPSPWDQSFPGGFSIDGTVEFTVRKGMSGWSGGLNFDVSFAEDIVYDSYNNFNVNRTFNNYNLTPFIKYRLIIKNMAIYLGCGFGYSIMFVSNDKQFEEIKDGMLSVNARLGFDYAFNNGVIISAEGVYHGMTGIDFGGDPRQNKMLQLKMGVGYVFRLPK